MKNGGRIIFSHPIIKPNCRSRKGEKRIHHEAIEIRYFIDGSSDLMIDDKIVKAKPGDVIVINPSEYCTTIKKGWKTGRYHSLIVPLEFFSNETEVVFELKQKLMEGRVRLQSQIKATSLIKYNILRIIVEHIEKPQFYHMNIRSLLLELFTLLFRDFANEQN